MKMKTKKDYLTIAVIILLMITSIFGILSANFTRSYEVVNQYGQTVEMFGYGIYAHDTYFQAPISIGTDICILLVVVPMFVIAYHRYSKSGSAAAHLELISIYGVALYYAASLAFGLTYNRLFLVYVALFACSLFGMFRQIGHLELTNKATATRGLTIFLSLSGIALVIAWLPDIIPTLISGETLSLIGVYTTCITYVLDMGIICPLCFVTLYLLKKEDARGTLLLAILLKACIIIGVMMFPQMICQIISGCDMPLIALVTKSFSFILLGGFAFFFHKKLYHQITQ